VHTKFNRPDVSLHGPDDQASYMEVRAPVQLSGRSKPYYGNFVQPKCNRPDARATPSGRGLVMEAFQGYLGEAVAVDRPDARSSRPDTLEYFGHNFLLKYRIGMKSASLESLEKML
jgi:hypothetical protein